MASPTITNLSKFLPMVQPYALKVPAITATQALRSAAIEFCERTHVWRQTMAISVSAAEHTPLVPVYAAIHRIEKATWDDDTVLTPAQYEDFDETDFADTAPPAYITQTGPGTVLLVPFDAAGTLDVSLILKPRHGDVFVIDDDDVPENLHDTVPEFLYTHHGEAITAGALSRILTIPNQPFTNYELAAVFSARFERAADKGFSDGIKGQQRAPIRARPSFF